LGWPRFISASRIEPYSLFLSEPISPRLGNGFKKGEVIAEKETREIEREDIVH
jgi:hypothetical protein